MFLEFCFHLNFYFQKGLNKGAGRIALPIKKYQIKQNSIFLLVLEIIGDCFC